ncbi:MAG TPA: hypothetical protein VJA47_02090 [archaeon]|nr:hypothetical protein [archaeon]
MEGRYVEVDRGDFETVNSRERRPRKNHIAALFLYGAFALNGCASMQKEDPLAFIPGETQRAPWYSPSPRAAKKLDSWFGTRMEQSLHENDYLRWAGDSVIVSVILAGLKAVYDHNHPRTGRDKPVQEPVVAKRVGGDSD